MEEKNSNRGLVVGLIICIIIILLLTGLLVWKFIDKDSNNENTEVNTNEKQEETTSYDLTDAKKLIDKYLTNGVGSFGLDYYFEKGYDNDAKGYLAYQNIKKNQVKMVSCEEIYSENSDFTYDGNGSWYNSESLFCDGTTSTTAVSYDALNEVYKELFGSDEKLPKEDIKFVFSNYNYDKKTDLFVSLSCHCGGAGDTYHGYGIKSASKMSNTLIIDVGYYVLEYNHDNNTYSSKITDKTYTNEDIEKSNFDSEFFNEFKDKMDTYRFTFEYEVDHYVLKDMKKR